MATSVCALVKWVDEDSWDVLPLKNCVTDIGDRVRDAVGTVVDFYWRKGEESAPCILLAYGKLKEMERQREELATASATHGMHDEEPGPSVLGVSQRAVKRPARLALHDTDEAEQPKIRKKKPTATASATSHSILKQIVERHAALPTGDTEVQQSCRCKKYDALKAKYADVKKEKMALQNQVEELTKYKELHIIVGRLENCVQQMDVKVTGPTAATATTKATATSPATAKLPIVLQDPPKSDVKTSTKVDIGNGVLIEKVKLISVTQTSDTATKLARNLFVSLFRKEDVIGRSLTGKPSNAHLLTAVQKERLDPSKVGSIIDFTINKFPGASPSIVRQSLANKVKEINKLM